LVYSDNGKSDATAYIAYPPTLIWFHGDKTSELGRELVLFDESKVVSGHSTPAFWKLANRNGQLPRHELCFSVISTTRSLDCAAESPSSANEWKEGLETFLNSIFKRNDSKYINNNDEYSDINKPPPPMLPPPGYRQNKSKNVAPPPPPPPPPPVAEDPFKQEILLKQLFVASHTGNNTLLQELLGQGINVNSMEAGTSDTPLLIACRKGDAVGVKICLEFGARNDPHPEFGQTALHAGVDECQYDAISVLLAAAAESQADHIICNLADPKGQTPLHLAVIRGSMSIIELLITHGADIARIDDIGQTCLHLCCELGFEQILALLLDHGGDFLLEQPDRDGNTPLHIASLYGFFPCVKLLLETAAEVMAVNRKGLTPYNLASSRGHHQVGLLLLEYQGHHNTASTVSTAATTNTMHNNYYTTQNTKQPVVNNTIFTGGQFSPIASRPYVPPEVEGMHNFSVDVREPPSTYKYNDGSPVVIRKVNRVSNLPRPHTSPNVVNKVNNTNTTMTTSPVVNHKVSTGALSARTTADYNTETIGSKIYSPLSARERPAPSLFETTTATTASSMSPLLREQGISSRPRTSSSNMTLNNPSAYYESNNPTVSSPVASPVSSPVFINPITMTVTNNNVTTNISDSPAVYDAKHSYDESNLDYTTTAQYEYSQPIETFHHIGRTWSSYYSEEGYVYYLDTNSEHSQWEDPRTHGFILQITTEDTSIARQLSPPKCPSPKLRSPASGYNNYSNNFNFDDEKLSVSKQLFNHDDDSKRSSKEAHSKEEVDEKHADVPAPPPPTDGSKNNGDVAAMLSLLQKFNLDISIPIKAEEKKEIDETSGGNQVKEYGSKADVNITKYQKMISLGCGLDNVVSKMKADGVATYLIDQFYRENTENTAV
jgi:ankyrin repeat protein